MKFTLILPTLVALAGAMPAAPADLDTRVVACGNLPLGNATSPPLDTVDSFLGFGEYSNAALAAKAPAGFKAAFTNAKATTEALGYQTYIALSKTYDVDACAAKCRSITNCKGFNIYFERDPSQSVAKACPNPKPTYFIRCTFWSTVLQAADVKNTGSTEEEFRIVIAGSNGYNVGP